MRLSRNTRCLQRGLVLGVALLAAACATNPVTGKKQLSFMSEDQEIRLGQELDAEVRREMGVYEDSKLQQYVEDVGLRLAKQSQRPNLPWHFTIVDSPAINAFALPGGYIYITRGIMPFLDNEAQLAGVLGHEIGHVTARHAAQQYTRASATSIGVLIGSIFVPGVAPFRDLAQTGLGVAFLKFSRNDELQADALGAEYAAAGGWDPAQVPAFLTTLSRVDELSDHSGTPNWLATHPQPENRVARVTTTVQKVRDEGNIGTVERDSYLERIDGMMFGDNPEEGIVRGHHFIHPTLRFAIDFPEGWDITNGEEEVIAQEPGNKVFIVFRAVREPSANTLEQVAQKHMNGAGYKTTEAALTTIDGMDAVVGTYQGSARNIGKVMARGAHLAMAPASLRSSRRVPAGTGAPGSTLSPRATTYFIGGIAPTEVFPNQIGAFNATIRSFRQLSPNEADDVEPNRVGLYTAREGDTWQSIAQRAGKGLVKASTLAIMNDHAADDQPKAGERLKIVVAGAGEPRR
ncbi:MAG TPA: M48 family metalloprotease [Longimicrobiales bacterium]|nr:M48 family metalloprotease [Longimicrobiales bacterium]